MASKIGVLWIIAILVTAMAACAQEPQLQPDISPDEHAPVVTFSFDFPGAQPGEYSIAVASTGRAAFRSQDVPDGGAATTGEPYLVKITVTEETTKRIFGLARALNYFQGDYEYRSGRLANMGAKTLRFKDGTRQNETRFNYSVNPQIQELTRLFQNMANSLEFGRRLEHRYRYDKLGLEEELRRMEQQAKDKNLAELQVDEAILRQIADDHSVMNITRRRAEHLLSLISTSTAGQVSASDKPR